MKGVYVALVGVGLAMIVSCDTLRSPKPAACPSEGFLMTGRGVEFVACAAPAKVSSGERRILVALINGSKNPVLVRGRLDIEDGLRISIMSEAGSWERLPLQDSYLWEQLDIPALENVVIPAGGLFARVLDLACPMPDYGTDGATGCYPLFDFSQPGTYRLQIEYEGWVCRDAPCSRSNSLPEAQSSFRQEIDLVVGD